MPASRLRRLRGLLRTTPSSESMDRLNDIPMRPAAARPKPAPAMVMAPDKSRFQRHSAHLRTRIAGAVGVEATASIATTEQPLEVAEVQDLATEINESPATVDLVPEQDEEPEVGEPGTDEAENDEAAQGQ